MTAVDEVRRLLNEADADLNMARAELASAMRKIRRSVLHDVALGVAVLVAIVAVIFALVAQHEGDRRQHCVEQWANAYTSRAQAASNAASKRSDALDKLVRTVPDRSATEFEHALTAYLRASDDYGRFVARHPIPALDLRC